jgi:hypothetical protein
VDEKDETTQETILIGEVVPRVTPAGTYVDAARAAGLGDPLPRAIARVGRAAKEALAARRPEAVVLEACRRLGATNAGPAAFERVLAEVEGGRPMRRQFVSQEDETANYLASLEALKYAPDADVEYAR